MRPGQDLAHPLTDINSGIPDIIVHIANPISTEERRAYADPCRPPCRPPCTIIDNELEDDPVTDDEQPTMANLVAAYSEYNITITGFEAITLKAEPDDPEFYFDT